MSTRVIIRIHSDRRFGLTALLVVAALVGAFLAYLLWGQTRPAAGMGISQPASSSKTASGATTGGVRQYYLTQSIAFDGDEAEGACAPGYHMASVWELLDTSNLLYNTALGRTQADSGDGPPSNWEGWVRTGYGITTTNVLAGQANCNGWSSDSSSHRGTSIYLPYDWMADQDLSTWMSGTWPCNTTMPVWCVASENVGLAAGVTGMRQYYLTTSDSYSPSQAPTACAASYHMASMWEIVDTSNLRYNTSLGETRLDSGQGPPSFSDGWIHTGYANSDGKAPDGVGQANCSTWSSDSAGDYGTVVGLPWDWYNPALQNVSVWHPTLRGCQYTAHVWCVADVGTCAGPLHIGCGQTVNGDTSVSFANNIGSYSCSGWNESGPETIYAFTLAAGDLYTVTAEISNMTEDLDVFLLSSGGCASAQCLGDNSYGNTIATIGPVVPGTYYVAVDGYNGVSDSYTLQLTCTDGAGEKVYTPLVLRDYP